MNGISHYKLHCFFFVCLFVCLFVLFCFVFLLDVDLDQIHIKLTVMTEVYYVYVSFCKFRSKFIKWCQRYDLNSELQDFRNIWEFLASRQICGSATKCDGFFLGPNHSSGKKKKKIQVNPSSSFWINLTNKQSSPLISLEVVLGSLVTICIIRPFKMSSIFLWQPRPGRLSTVPWTLNFWITCATLVTGSLSCSEMVL